MALKKINECDKKTEMKMKINYPRIFGSEGKGNGCKDQKIVFLG